MSQHRPRVFLDVTIDKAPVGRLAIELFVDKTPKTCENFRQLCVGHEGVSFAGCPFHRVIEEFMVQGGDIDKQDGTGTYSIYGSEFEDENLNWREVDAAGLVCSANRGKNTNGSQFFITLEAQPHLNGKHTIFGRLVTGSEVLEKISKVAVDNDDRPRVPVIISRCGELERKRKRELESRGAISEDRGRQRPTYAARDPINVDPPQERPRRQSDNTVDEGLRGRPRKRSKQSKPDVILDEDDSQLSGDQQSPVKMHKRKRSSSPSRHVDRRSDVEEHYPRRRRRSLPNQHDDYQNRSRRDDKYQPTRERYNGQYRDERRQRDDRYRPDNGRLTNHEQDDSTSGVKFKGRGVMKYRG